MTDASIAASRESFLDTADQKRKEMKHTLCGVCDSCVDYSVRDEHPLVVQYSVCQCKYELLVEKFERMASLVVLRKTDDKAVLIQRPLTREGDAIEAGIEFHIARDSSRGLDKRRLELYSDAQLNFAIQEVRLALLGEKCPTCKNTPDLQLRAGQQLTLIACQCQFNHHVRNLLNMHHSCKVLSVSAEGVKVSGPEHLQPLAGCDRSMLVVYVA